MSSSAPSARLPSPLARVHRAARRSRWLQRFTVFTRFLLAIGFISPGLTKVLGHRFHNPDVLTSNTAIGAFFEAFFQAPEFYMFVGAAQVVAGLLLVIPRTSLLGALLYTPIIANIFAITVSLEFGNTAIITGGMLLAAVYLLCWDADRLVALVPRRTDALAHVTGRLDAVGLVLFLVGGVLMTTRGHLPMIFNAVGAGAFLIGALLFAVATLRGGRRATE